MTDEVTAADPGGAVGRVLRQRRLQKNLTAEQSAQDTRINIKFIRALEDEKWADFPARVYLEGFLKRYAGYLGLDEEELLKELRLVLRVVEKPGFSAPQPRDEEKEDGSMQTNSARPLGLLLFGALLVLSLTLAYVKLEERRASQNRPAPVTEPFNVAPPPPAPAIPAPETHDVRVTAVSPVWARVWVDGKVRFEGILPAGQEKAWTAETSLRVTAGNMGALKVLVDGNTMAPPADGPSGEILWREPADAPAPPPPTLP